MASVQQQGKGRSGLRRLVENPPQWLGFGLLALVLALVLMRNLPWHLDDKDQAKQAFIAVEILSRGGEAFWFQHTPDGDIATKPPLMGWISAALRTLGLPWDLAWRLPGILACGWILWALWQRGKDLGRSRKGGWIAWAGVACFGLNLLTPRLASLVRTDMLLAACCAWAVFLVYDRLRTQEVAASEGENQGKQGGASAAKGKQQTSWLVVLALSLAALLKGPVAWVFLLPGVLLYLLSSWWMQRRGSLNSRVKLPVSWWAWFLPLVPFVAWSLAAMHWQEGFYEQVIVREFLGRFQGGEEATHNTQHPFFYLLQGSKSLAPWVLLLLVISLLDWRVWGRICQQPSSLWLLCCFVGALLFMSAIPSKRLDRIFPALMPLALLIPALLAQTRLSSRFWLAASATLLAALAYASYAVMQVRRNWPESAAFTRVLRDELRPEFTTRGIALGQGEVASLENDYEALFVWLPEVVSVSKQEWKQLAKQHAKQSAEQAPSYRAVFVLQKNAKQVSKAFPEATLLKTIPSPQEAKNQEPLQLWLLEGSN